MLSGRAMYIWHLKSVIGVGSADDVVAQAKRARISSLWIKIGDGAKPFENTRGAVGGLLKDLVAACSAARIDVLGYHVPSCATAQNTSDEIDFVAKTVATFNLAGVVVDNEDGASYFKGTEATAAQYATGLSAAMKKAGKIVVMSSNDIISAHPHAYATVIGKSIDVNAPQAYYGQSPSVSSRLNWALRENKVVHAPFFPVGAAFLRQPQENDGGFLDPVKCGEAAREFIRLVALLHHASPETYPGYGFWNWEEAPEEVWQALYDADVFVQPDDRLDVAALNVAEPAVPPALGLETVGVEAALAPPAASAGWTLSVQRLREQRRPGEGFARTIGTYTILHNGVPQPRLSGMTVERQGPGDNGPIGKAQHRCIAAGAYPLRPHASAKYRTTGYASNGDHPRPALEVGETGSRVAILVHPADGYGSTIGCINLAGQLADADSDILLSDSIARVAAVIEDLRQFCGGRLRVGEDGAITNATLVIADKTAGVPMEMALEAVFAPAAAAPPAQDCLIYEQATGRMLVKEDGGYDTLGVGYSGSLSKGGKNDPAKQCEKRIGPIPRGLYTIGAPGLGPSPYSLRLTPDPGNDMCGRRGFLIHGDSVSHPGDASDGCIILSRPEREAIVKTGLKLLFVTDCISN